MTKPITGWTGAQAALAGLDGRLFATVQEVSAVLGCDPQGRTVRRAIEAGEIPAVKAGNTQWRIPVTWLRQAAGLSET